MKFGTYYFGLTLFFCSFPSYLLGMEKPDSWNPDQNNIIEILDDTEQEPSQIFLFEELAHDIIREGIPYLTTLLSLGYNFQEQRDIQGRTLLHYLAIEGNAELIERFLHNNDKHVKMLLARDNYGNTPLHLAAPHNRAGVIKILSVQKLISGTTISALNSLNNDQMSPLAIASDANNRDAVRQLYRLGAKSFRPRKAPGSQNLNNLSPRPLELCQTASVAEALEHIGTEDSGVQQPPIIDLTKDPIDDKISQLEHEYFIKSMLLPLHFAVLNNDIQKVKILLNDHQTDPNAQDHRGTTALHRLATMNNLELTWLLLWDYRINTNVQNTAGYTALHLATLRNNVGMVAALLSHPLTNPQIRDTLRFHST